VKDYVMDWIIFDPPYFWKKIGRNVLADRYLPDGTRQHVVEGYIPPNTIINNAQIFGEDVLNERLRTHEQRECNFSC
jgi:hypothetical protein